MFLNAQFKNVSYGFDIMWLSLKNCTAYFDAEMFSKVILLLLPTRSLIHK